LLTFVKLGGSLITNKQEAESFHADLMAEVASALVHAFEQGVPLLVGHGSGSFGHSAAAKHGTMDGVRTADQWIGFAEVAFVARQLNTLVVDALASAGLPIFAFQPSASARCRDGVLESMEVTPLTLALSEGLVPVVYGDVAFDSVRGGTIISTETIFRYLAGRLKPSRIFLIGDMAGVYDQRKQIIPLISPANYEAVAAQIGASGGVDVTGGMATKVRDMIALATAVPGLDIRIFGGGTPEQISQALLGESEPGTRIIGDEPL